MTAKGRGQRWRAIHTLVEIIERGFDVEFKRTSNPTVYGLGLRAYSSEEVQWFDAGTPVDCLLQVKLDELPRVAGFQARYTDGGVRMLVVAQLREEPKD